MRLLSLVVAASLAPVAAAGPVHAREAALTPLLVHSHDTTLGSRTVLRAWVRAVHCGEYGGCRAAADEGTIEWTLVSRRHPELQIRHRSVVQDGRARWRTPRLTTRGTWLFKAAFSGTDAIPAADCSGTFRVTRR